jgi:hypothetical protein
MTIPRVLSLIYGRTQTREFRGVHSKLVSSAHRTICDGCLGRSFSRYMISHGAYPRKFSEKKHDRGRPWRLNQRTHIEPRLPLELLIESWFLSINKHSEETRTNDGRSSAKSNYRSRCNAVAGHTRRSSRCRKHIRPTKNKSASRKAPLLSSRCCRVGAIGF